MQKENEKPKKIRKIVLSYSIDSFTTLTSYHQSRGIAEAFFISAAAILTVDYLGYDVLVSVAFCGIMSLMYLFYHYFLRKKLSNASEWEEKEIEEKEEEIN
jgi:Ca2+/Na+ antiporter